ncbi:MAG: hemolysin III family protein [Planctomycetota bacterium]|nr:hemolysin III family protein [Planctomycetota bacterium]MDA1212617.1 hemolysin III family protein [Planctomycetota bacterium]
MHTIHALPEFGFREPFSVLSHLLGVGIFVVLSWRLIRSGRGDAGRTISLCVMAFTSVQTLLVSSLYHALWPGPERELMLRADVAGIFLLIAGSMTPVHLILFKGAWRWGPLAVAWATAFVGAWLRLAVYEGGPGIGGTMIFLFFGWAAAITSFEIWRRHGWHCIRMAVYGGLTYTTGAIMLMMQWPTLITGVIGWHEIWHVAVLGGLGLHWRFIFQIASRDHWPVSTIVRMPGVSLPRRTWRPAIYMLNGLSAYAAKQRRERLRTAIMSNETTIGT